MNSERSHGGVTGDRLSRGSTAKKLSMTVSTVAVLKESSRRRVDVTIFRPASVKAQRLHARIFNELHRPCRPYISRPAQFADDVHTSFDSIQRNTRSSKKKHLAVYCHRPWGSFTGGDELTQHIGRRHAAIEKVRLHVVDAGIQEKLLVVVFLV